MIVNNVAALKALTTGGMVDLLGYHSPNDGGSGRFYFDSASTSPDDGGTIISPTSGVGRWKRIFSEPVHVDWFGASGSDATAAFEAASAFQHIECSPRTYLMNAVLAIKAGQVWEFNGAVIRHTDEAKVMFTANAVEGWALVGPCTLKGTLSGSGWTGEKGLDVIGCNKYRVSAVTASLFKGHGIHVQPGTFAGLKADQGQWTDCAAYECMVGLQVDNGSGAEYNTFSNFNAGGNITGVQIAAGNTIMSGGTIGQNTTGVSLLGGANNGHGIFSGVNINHNGAYNIKADGVTNGYTFSGCHFYGDSPTAGRIWFANGSTDIVLSDCVVGSAIVNDSGLNRVTNSKVYGNYSVSGSAPAGLIASGNF